jgi:hypothetical protein
MRQASCGSMMFAIIIHYHLLISIFSSIFSVCSGSMRGVSCGSMMLAIIIYYLFIYYLVPAAAVCVRHPAAA